MLRIVRDLGKVTRKVGNYVQKNLFVGISYMLNGLCGGYGDVRDSICRSCRFGSGGR